MLLAQGMIVNEMSNGDSGTREFMEFVVIGSAANPTDEVDLSGWLIDDNNGDFEALASGQGIASGHFRIAAGCLTNVKPGSIIVIYNEADPNTQIPFGASDPNDANADCVYFFRSTDPCIEECSSTPVVPSTTNGNYASCGGYGQNLNWNSIGLSNSQDAAQVRLPDGTFYHGYSYGLNAPYPTFHTSLGGGSSFRVPGSGSGANFFFNCGSFTDVGNFSKGNALSDDTPGLPNNDQNRFFINQIIRGTFDYSNLSNPTNCGLATALDDCYLILDTKLDRFDVKKDQEFALISWVVTSDFEFDVTYFIEHSSNGYDFSLIGQFDAIDQVTEYEFIHDDAHKNRNNYYRLRINEDGFDHFSPVRHIAFSSQTYMLNVSPNPVNDVLVIDYNDITQSTVFEIRNTLGQICKTGFLSDNSTSISCSDLPSGNYLLTVRNNVSSSTVKFIK
jgi:hypothetical protein